MKMDQIKKWEEKIKQKVLKHKTNIYMIFNNLKQQYLWVTVIILVKLIQMKLRWITQIY